MWGAHRGVDNVGNVKFLAGGLDDGRDQRIMCVANAREQMVHNLHVTGSSHSHTNDIDIHSYTCLQSKDYLGIHKNPCD